MKFEFINEWVNAGLFNWISWIHLLNWSIYKNEFILCFEFVILGVGFEITLDRR